MGPTGWQTAGTRRGPNATNARVVLDKIRPPIPSNGSRLGKSTAELSGSRSSCRETRKFSVSTGSKGVERFFFFLTIPKTDYAITDEERGDCRTRVGRPVTGTNGFRFTTAATAAGRSKNRIVPTVTRRHTFDEFPVTRYRRNRFTGDKRP